MSTTMEKVPVYVTQEMKKQIDAAMVLANSHSRSDFCREALAFYIGYLNHSSTVDYLSPLLVSILKSELKSSTKFICETLYNVAVETSINSQITALTCNYDLDFVRQLRQVCEIDVAESNGIITAEQAVKRAEEGYSPTNAQGKREVHTVYAKTREEAEALLKEMIREVRARIDAEKAVLKAKQTEQQEAEKGKG